MNETSTFLQIMGILISLGLGATVWLFRKGGTYNPPMPKDFTELEYLPLVEAPKQPSPAILPQETLYQLAKAHIGQHLTVNTGIPPSLGCADTVSWLLRKAGYPIPKKGIPTVAELTKWMLAQGFIEATGYQKGFIITGRNQTSAHIGICGKDWIMSNTSFTVPEKELVEGLFQANYRLTGWLKVYPQTRYFMPAEVLG